MPGVSLLPLGVGSKPIRQTAAFALQTIWTVNFSPSPRYPGSWVSSVSSVPFADDPGTDTSLSEVGWYKSNRVHVQFILEISAMNVPSYLVVRNDSWNFSELPHEFTVWLRVENLEEQLDTAIARFTAHFEKYPGEANSKSQKVVELRRLIAFQDRVRKMDNASSPISVGATELPVSFNEQIFEGNFVSLFCLNCYRLSPPELTCLVPFQNDTYEQAFGTMRHCLCGKSIAWRIDGQRRP